ncbi:MAG: flagellar biosynthesis protein FlhF [Lachnospiraceae bacterium]|nr:flagellar biosynthesis protein FlhF [Lachnospiraceae bacterium]
MIIKKYQGKTEEEATELARKELGDGIIVMNVKNVKKKGFFAFFSRPLVEVTVALEEETERFVPVKREAPIPAQGGFTKNTPITNAWRKQAEEASDKSSTEMNVIGEKLDSLQSLLEQQFQKSQNQESEKEEESVPEKPVKQIEEPKSEELVKFMKLMYNMMLENEVDEKYINQIMDEIEKVHKPNMPFDYALANTYQKMILKFGPGTEIMPAGKGPKVIYFVGPTGVGKTTTIAKLASRFSVDEKKKVALLTADTYRIAAAEQLKTYAGILDAPFRVIYTIEELENALVEFKEFDYLFVDTAGHSHQNQAQKEAMSAFVRCLDGQVEKEVYLVLSATTKYRDLLSIADSYREIADYKLIFTKLDETSAYGNLLNLALYTGASLAYVTFGQNVPEDMEKFNPQKTVKQLLGGKKQ